MRAWRFWLPCAALAAASAGFLSSCGSSDRIQAKDGSIESSDVSVGIAKVGRKTLERTLQLSSELEPFQQIDVYAKEAGFVKGITVDYGSHVQAGQVMATLEIPELEAQLKQDDATIKNAEAQVRHAGEALSRYEDTHKALQLAYDRLDGVSKSKPGLVAQQEVDDAEAKALASAAQIEEAKSSVDSAQSRLVEAQAKKEHDQALFDYSKITAPFAGVVTQRYANEGTLMQAGTNSSTQVLPLVHLSEDDHFRLQIPVPESYVHYIHVGDPVSVFIPSLNRRFPGKVARFSVDVREDTRTMHTEVDVFNPDRALLPGLYAEATITLERRANTLAVPLQAVNQGDHPTVDVVTDSNTIEVQPVTLGVQTEADAEILSGLKEGESIVVSDRSGLRAGQHVQPKAVELVSYKDQDKP
jgi:RND family efflux transporter MFP subunit